MRDSSCGFYGKYIAADGRAELARFAELDRAFTDKVAAMKAKAAKENPVPWNSGVGLGR